VETPVFELPERGYGLTGGVVTRALVVEEILVTEENYIDDLRVCIDVRAAQKSAPYSCQYVIIASFRKTKARFSRPMPQHYLFPLRNSAHLMKPADVTHVFSNMEFLCVVLHSFFLFYFLFIY
jgi:hypothetical protein